MKKYISLVTILIIVGVAFFVGQVYAAATITTPATNSVSSDSLGAGTSVTLPNILITEAVAGDINAGVITLTAPAGYNFDQTSIPDVVYTGAGLAGSAVATMTASTLSVTVSNVSSVAGTLRIGSVTPIKVRVTAGTPMAAAGNILMTAGTITGLNGASNFGTLTQIAGVAATLSVSGITDPVVAGVSVGGNVTALDQFGNTDTSYVGLVNFTSTDAAAVMQGTNTYQFVGGDNGSRTFANGFVLSTAGEQSVTATDSVTGSITGQQTAITVTPAALDHFHVVFTPATVASGANIATTITGVDVYNNPTTVGWTAGTVALTADNAATVYPATIATTAFTSGAWSGNISLDVVASPVTVTATNNAKTGTDTVITTVNNITMTCESSGQAGAVWLRWTEPAQTATGLFTGYVVKHYTGTVTTANWAAGPTTITQTWTPASAQGSSVQQLVTGLNPNTRYYFGIKLGKAGDTIDGSTVANSPTCIAPSSSSGLHDFTAPTSFITSPAASATIGTAQTIVISGTAQDTGGSSVQQVEISIDGGVTWNLAHVNTGDTGTNVSWTYNWVNATTGSHNIQSRAYDWVGNRETASTGITVTVSNTVPPTTTTVTTTTTTTTTTTSGPMTIDQMKAKIAELQTTLVQLLVQLVAVLTAQLH